MSDDSLGDRMKWYESLFTKDQFMPYLPVMARLDGRAFHTFTKGLSRPYCQNLSRLMIETTKHLVQETNARCGYTQSDEISLVWLTEDSDSDILFAGKLQKMNSVLASMASVFFNRKLADYLPEKRDQSPIFDCRVFQVPTEFEATNCFIWREQDATRNSLQMAARAYFSHEELHAKGSAELHEMLHSKGVNWNDYPQFFKRGTYVRKRNVCRALTAEELAALPEKHLARNNPDFQFTRTAVMEEEFEPLARMENREEVILHGAEPVLKADLTKES